MNGRAVVLFSGGMDSTAALWWARDRGHAVVTLAFNHPGRPRREREAARALARAAEVERHVEVEASFLVEPPGGAPPGYLPRRNLVYYAIAASVAEQVDARILVGGHLRHDEQGYPDAAPSYFDALNGVLRSGALPGGRGGCEIVLPFIEMTKMELALIGRRRGVPFERTWSCFRDGEAPCGRCLSCVDRYRSFRAVGVPDPAFPRGLP